MARNKFLKRIKRALSYWLVRILIAVFRSIPRKLAIGIGTAIGRALPLFAQKEFGQAVTHLAIAFGPEKSETEIRLLAREVFLNLALNFIDTIRVGAMRADAIQDVCVPHHLDRLHRALEEGHGVIGLGSHSGCWELMGAYLVNNGVHVSAVGRRLYDDRMERLLSASRRKCGIENLTRGQDTREVIRALKRGRMVAILIDQDYVNVKGVFVDFFGQPANTAVGPSVLSLKYGAPVVPVLTFRDRSHRHHVCIGEPLTIERSGSLDTDMERLTAASLAAIEEFVREHPDQWPWFHDRWRTRPEPDGPAVVVPE